MSEKSFSITKAANGYIITVSWSEPTAYMGHASIGSSPKSSQYICVDWDAVIEILKGLVK